METSHYRSYSAAVECSSRIFAGYVVAVKFAQASLYRFTVRIDREPGEDEGELAGVAS